MNIIEKWQQRRLRRAMAVLADHIVVVRGARAVVGVDCARNDLDTIVFGIKEDIRIELSESIKMAVRSVPR